MTQEIRAEMPGNVWKVEVTEGQVIRPDDVLIILESMKMEIPVIATTAGMVREIPVSEGDAIEQDSLLLVLE